MTAPTVTGKAARLLTAGALQVLEVNTLMVRAVCRGDSGRLWRCGWWRGSWGCSCPAGRFRAVCAHLEALQLICPGPTRRT